MIGDYFPNCLSQNLPALETFLDFSVIHFLLVLPYFPKCSLKFLKIFVNELFLFKIRVAKYLIFITLNDLFDQYLMNI